VNGISQIDCIKIDVEGHELHMLNGAKRMLETCKPAIMIEFNTVALERSGSSPEELKALLHTLGYCLFLPVRAAIVPFKKEFGPHEICNVFALHRTAKDPSNTRPG
jgi:hypothetical protein